MIIANSQKNVFKKRKQSAVLLFLIVGGLYFFFAHRLNFNGLSALSQIPSGFIWLGQNFIPNETALDGSFIITIIETLIRTIMITITATVTAAIFAFIAAVFGSKKTGVHWTLVYMVRIIAMLFRNIPLIAWAMILLISFRQSEFTGYLALVFGSFGYLTRTFSEIIDEISDGILEALHATGASYFQIIFQGVLPMISSQLISWLLFSIESNVREAALVGLLTGTGIGFLFNFYFSSFRYPRAGMVLLFIIITVLLLETLSNKIRRLVM